MLALAGFVVLVIMLLPHLNPPGARTADDMAPPGNVIVEVRWPTRSTPMSTSGSPRRVTSRLAIPTRGGAFNLLRDDLGRRVDVTGLNYDPPTPGAFTPGEYAVNLHLYRNPSGSYPVPVTVVTSVKAGPRSTARQILASKVPLGPRVRR